MASTRPLKRARTDGAAVLEGTVGPAAIAALTAAAAAIAAAAAEINAELFRATDQNRRIEASALLGRLDGTIEDGRSILPSEVGALNHAVLHGADDPGTAVTDQSCVNADADGCVRVVHKYPALVTWINGDDDRGVTVTDVRTRHDLFRAIEAVVDRREPYEQSRRIWAIVDQVKVDPVDPIKTAFRLLRALRTVIEVPAVSSCLLRLALQCIPAEIGEHILQRVGAWDHPIIVDPKSFHTDMGKAALYTFPFVLRNATHVSIQSSDFPGAKVDTKTESFITANMNISGIHQVSGDRTICMAGKANCVGFLQFRSARSRWSCDKQRVSMRHLICPGLQPVVAAADDTEYIPTLRTPTSSPTYHD